MKSPIHQIHKMPLLFVAICFLVGILLNKIYFNNRLFCGLWILILLTISILFKIKKFSVFVLQAINILLPLLIILSGSISMSLHKSRIMNIASIPSIYRGYITDELKVKDKYADYLVQLTSEFVEDSIIPLDEKIHFRGFDSTINHQLKPGSTLLFKGALRKIENMGNPGEFDYKKYMANQNIYYHITCFKGYTVTPRKKQSIKIAANNLRSTLISKFQEYQISTKSISLLSALTLGDKTQLSRETKDSFANSGAMHVLAVSGLHVGILFFLFNFLLNFLLPKHRFKIFKLILIILILWFYAFITGLAPSVMRSGIMFTIIAIGSNLKRKGNIYNSIGTSALILMIIEPKVIFEVGFQLSYLALIAIVFFQPRIANLLKIKNILLRKLWQLTSVSLAAQIGTAPIALYYFHQFPVYFWLSNLIVIPAAAIILYSTFLFFIISGIPFLAGKLAFILDEFISFVMRSIQLISQFPNSVIDNVYISNSSLITIYLLLIFVIFYIFHQHKKYIFYMLASLCLFFSSVLFSNMQLLNNRKLIIYKTFEPYLISIIDGKNHFYLSSKDSLNNYETELLQQTSGLNHTHSPKKIDLNNFSINGRADYQVLKLDSLKINITEFSQNTVDFESPFNIQIKYTDKQLYLNYINQQTARETKIRRNHSTKITSGIQAINKAFVLDF